MASFTFLKRMDNQRDRLMDKQTYLRAVGWTDRQMARLMDEQTNEQTCKQIDGKQLLNKPQTILIFV
jgi:hypothetical protein